MKEFVVLAEIGNFTEASRNLFISQPVLSKHIKIMENDLGVQLFIRNKRSMELSEYGKVLLPYARQVVKIQEDYLSALSSKIHNVAGTLTIGSIPAVSHYGIADVISGFIRENPNISVNIVEGENGPLIDSLHQKECDFAFVRGIDERYSDIMRIPFTTDRMIGVLPDDHPMAGRESVLLEELRYEDFLLTSEVNYSYRVCINACKKAGFTPNVVYTSNSGKNVIEMVRRGHGITITSRKPALAWRGSGVSFVEIMPPIVTEISLYYNKTQNMNLAASQFLSYVSSNTFRKE